MSKTVEIVKGNTLVIPEIRGIDTNKRRVAAYARVSTDKEDQLNSQKNQLEFFEDMIKNNPDWTYICIFEDEGISGTSTKKRHGFQDMIEAARRGEFDLLLVKSISRFARNTLDLIQNVRLLKEYNVEVRFLEENIDTFSKDGELLFTMMGTIAQQEVMNTSSHVTKILNFKAQQGMVLGFSGCLGYDYDSKTKKISIIEEEAIIVRYIFKRYIDGIGCRLIARELESLGYKSKKGSTKWSEGSITRIISNEKYCGELLNGKTITVDPISKKRVKNFGDKYKVSNHHEAIISKEDFEKAQIIRSKRAVSKAIDFQGKRARYSRQYPLSSKLECGFCGTSLGRRTWNNEGINKKPVFHCLKSSKKGKQYCPESKGIQEVAIMQSFVESYNRLTELNGVPIDEFLKRVEDILNNDSSLKEIKKFENQIAEFKKNLTKLIDMKMKEQIDDDEYSAKKAEVKAKLNFAEEQVALLKESSNVQAVSKERIASFRKVLQSNKILTEFDPIVFEAVVEKVICGGYNEEGNADPYMLKFVYRTGMDDSLDSSKYKVDRRRTNTQCSQSVNEANIKCSQSVHNTC